MASTIVLLTLMVVFSCAWSGAVAQSSESMSTSVDESITPTASSTWEATTSTAGGSGQSPTATASTYTTATASATATATLANTATTAATATVTVTASSVSASSTQLALHSSLLRLGAWVKTACDNACCGPAGATFANKYIETRICNSTVINGVNVTELCNKYAHLLSRNESCPTCQNGKCLFGGGSGRAADRSPFFVLIISVLLLILGYLTV